MSGFTLIKNEIIKNTNISRSVRLFAIELLSRCYNDKTSCYPSQETLAKDMGVSVRTIQRWVKILKENNIIRVIRRGFNKTNEYFMLMKQKVIKGVTEVKKAMNKAHKSYTKAKGHFNNYNQRTYDFNDLEKGLLQY
ncbi:helix-turn-helix domain-containing protein [Clostridium culturomicium]|uniref:helix-turn-helix domain-containing protein n=1 Tax=Clostridium culturomicium TaxID=1499683 RepID=UPI00058DC3CE|nr:helix-turn-helix domain-containing protein [Clostridium culturomicium]